MPQFAVFVQQQTVSITVDTPNSGFPFTAPAPVKSFCTGVDSIPGALFCATITGMFERDILQAGFILLNSKNTFLNQKPHRAHSTPEFYFGIFFWFLRVLLLIQPEILVVGVQRFDKLAELLALVAQSQPIVTVGLVEALVVGDKCAVIGRESGLAFAVFVALLLRLVRLMLEAVVLCHLLSDGGALLLELLEPDHVRHNVQDLVSSLLVVIDRLVIIRSLLLEELDLALNGVDLLLHVGNCPRACTHWVLARVVLPIFDLVSHARHLGLEPLDLIHDVVLLLLDCLDSRVELGELVAQVGHLWVPCLVTVSEGEGSTIYFLDQKDSVLRCGFYF